MFKASVPVQKVGTDLVFKTKKHIKNSHETVPLKILLTQKGLHFPTHLKGQGHEVGTGSRYSIFLLN
jgi:hypothetical protein